MMIPMRLRRRSRPCVRQSADAHVKCAFTLIELLVVVAIIALLLAIMLPSLRRARAIAKNTACATHLKEIAVGWRMYFDMYDGAIPQDDNMEVNFGGQQGRAGPEYRVRKPLNEVLNLPPIIGRFTEPPPGPDTPRVDERDADLFRCPADTGSEDVFPSYYEHYGASYQMNIFITSKSLRPIYGDPLFVVTWKLDRRIEGLKVSGITTQPSELMLLADYGWETALRFNTRRKIDWHDEPSTHNLAFLDGHVKFTRIRKGLHVTKDYVMIPFRDLAEEAVDLQEPF